MSEKHNHCDDDQITFTLATGNQSAICGSVDPIALTNPRNEVKSQSEQMEEIASAR